MVKQSVSNFYGFHLPQPTLQAGDLLFELLLRIVKLILAYSCNFYNNLNLGDKNNNGNQKLNTMMIEVRPDQLKF